MSFLPEDYETPQTGGHYLKLTKGENKIRIVAKPTIGWLDWKDNKPLRYKMNEKPEKPVNPDKPIRHFWALYVWSYNNNAPMVLEITQATIQKAITDLSKDSDWGAPYAYDLKITKKGEDKNTEYSVTPSPKRPIDEAVFQEITKRPVYMDALFVNGDPFQVNGQQTEIELDPFQ